MIKLQTQFSFKKDICVKVIDKMDPIFYFLLDMLETWQLFSAPPFFTIHSLIFSFLIPELF